MPKAELPGFRPGRAPRKLVESRFKEHVADQVKGKLLMDSLTQMSDDQEFTAISEPDFDYRTRSSCPTTGRWGLSSISKSGPNSTCRGGRG